MIFLFPKIPNHFWVITLSMYREGWLLTTRKWWATTLPWAGVWVLSFPLSQCSRFIQAGVGWPPQPQGVSCMPWDSFQWGGFWTATSQQHLWRTAHALPEDLSSISGERVSPGEPPKGGSIRGENRTPPEESVQLLLPERIKFLDKRLKASRASKNNYKAEPAQASESDTQ